MLKFLDFRLPNTPYAPYTSYTPYAPYVHPHPSQVPSTKTAQEERGGIFGGGGQGAGENKFGGLLKKGLGSLFSAANSEDQQQVSVQWVKGV